MNITQITLNLFYSLLFIEGIFFSCKLYSKKSKIDKKFIYLLFINVILIISLCLYSLEKLGINVEILIYLLSTLFITFGILSFYVKFPNLSLIKKKNHYIFFLFIGIFLTASLIPATDADSIRYHLGQFNNKSFNKEIYDLHHKISFIGDSLNLISYQFKVYNLISVLNFYSLFRLYKILSSNIRINNNRLAIFMLLFGCPILLSLLLTQKSYLFVAYSYCYLFFIIEKSFKDELNKMIYHIVSAVIFLGMMKINFIYYSIIIFVLLFFKKIRLIKYFKSIIFCSSFFLLFCLINLYTYNDPLIFFVSYYFNPENLKPEVIEFINFLLGKYNDSQTGVFNYVLFLVDLILPMDYLKYFTVSLGLGFIVLILRANFLKFNSYFIIMLMFLIYNYYTNRLTLKLIHGRDYLIIYLLLILIVRDIFENKFILNKLFSVVLYFQLFITTIGMLFYIGTNLFFTDGKLAYQYDNELFLNKRYNHNNTLVITSIDGNLFKKYNYINADMLNHKLDDYFFANDLPNIRKRFDVLTVLVKETFWRKPWAKSKTLEALDMYPRGHTIPIEMNHKGTRNPINKQKKVIYWETHYYLNSYD